MMKKLTKAALLAAATAFLLAGFPACEHDDDNKTPPSVEGSTDGGDTGQSGGSTTGGTTGGGTTGGDSTGGTTGGDTGNESGLTGTWTALDYVTSTEYADKLAVDDGTKLGAVTVSGTGANWRGGQNTEKTAYNKWSHLELGKAEKGCLTFTIGAESTVVVEAASTGSNNTSDIALCSSSDGTGAVTGSANTVSGSYTEVTYATVSAGTYYLGAFPATTNGRGVRIKSITVTAK